jgi:hypothetical protein
MSHNPGSGDLPTTHAELVTFTREQRERAQVHVYREAQRLGLAGDPFVTAIADALGDISLAEALLALMREAANRDGR